MNQDFNYQPPSDENIYQDPNFAPAQPPQGHAKGYALTSMILGIASLFFACLCCCLYYISIVLSILSIAMAFLAKRDNGGKMPGMAIAGLICAIVGLVGFIIMLVFEISISNMDESSIIAFLDQFYMEYFGVSFSDMMDITLSAPPE